MSDFFVHPQAEVHTSRVGRETRIWQFCVVLEGAAIGSRCNICAHCFIEADVVIGDDVTIKNGVSVWDGVRIGNGAFIGPNVAFTNDKHPVSRRRPPEFLETWVGDGASIGANATILPGITLGAGCVVGAGAVVTRSVPPHAIVTGNPARIRGYTHASGAIKTPAARAAAPQPQPGVEGTVVQGVTIHRFKEVEDIRGRLTVGNFASEIPFVPRRYFIVYDVPSKETRGEHAHRQCHEFLLCVQGSCAIVVDDGAQRCEIELDSPSVGVYVPPMVWGIQYKYTPDAKLVVFTSDPYDPDDYIRSYPEFLRELGTRAPTQKPSRSETP